MKIPNFKRIAAFSAFLLVIVLVTAPPSTDAQLEIAAGILFAFALDTAFNLGASLGTNYRGRSNGYGRSYGRSQYRSRGRHYGKREAESFLNDIRDGEDENIISDGFDLMMKSDPDDCYRRLMCDVATGEGNFSALNPILNFVSDEEEKYVPAHLKNFSNQLKMARKLGEAARIITVCEDTFKCPFTGGKMSEMMVAKFEFMDTGYFPVETPESEFITPTFQGKEN